MASRFVDELLRDMELLGEGLGDSYTLKRLRIGLTHLRTFLLFASKWNEDVGSRSDENTSSSSSSRMIGSFLNRLEGSLIENGKNFHNLLLREKNEIDRFKNEIDRFDLIMRSAALEFYECICSFRQGIAESYITLSDCYTLQSWDQSLQVIGSLQANLADLLTQCHFLNGPAEEVESFRDKLAFFKNFIRFAQLRGFEPWQLQFLFAHLQVVAVNAARLCLDWVFQDGEMLEDETKPVEPQIGETKPVEPQIGETYVQVLTALKSSGASHALTLGTDRHVLGDFVDSLLHNILEALTYRDNYIASLKDQIPMLYGELSFLRTILANHLEKIDELHQKVKDLIGAAVNEAAIVIFSLFVHELEQGLAKELDFAILNFLEKIKLIKVITSAFIFPRTNEHGFVDFFLENLKELPSCKADSTVYARDQIHTVQEDLSSLRLSFPESVWDRRNQDGKLQSLWSHVAEVARKTRLVIESLVVEDIPDRSTLEFNLIKEEINLIKMEALTINDNQYSSEAQNFTKTSSPSPSQGSNPTINKIEVTLDDEANTIIGQLIRGSKQLDIISIVGMPGIGKTTLARSVYDHPSVRDLFHARAWCVISQVYKRKKLLLQILGCVDRNFCDNYSEWDEYELEEKLKKCLLRRRYLIVLDDIWDIDAWSGLARSFPDDTNSSRILLTSRLSDVAKKINPTREPHSLQLLTDKQSWNLLQKKLSYKKDYPLNLGMKIAKNCKGLPLTIVIVAGILANLEQDGWVEIAERLSLSDLPIIGQCMDMLEVSYKTLPENLRSCLLYFGAFREDEEIPCKRLIWLWKAEGFVQKCEAKSLEDVAKDCMNDLIGRNWVMVSREKAIGGAKTCRIHDLLHEFCVVKAKKEKFLSVLSGRNELFNFYGQRDLQRLCIRSTSEDFEKLRLFCPSVRSLLFDDDSFSGIDLRYSYISSIFHFCKLLKVLDLTSIYLFYTFPSEIALLVELRYLAIRGYLISIPPVVANLLNLETLLLHAFQISLPDTFWNLPKLRVLQSHGYIYLDSGLMPTNLHNLDTFSGMCVSLSQLEEIMRKLPNVRRLNCSLFMELEEFNADCKTIVVMDWLSRLESICLILLPLANEKEVYHIGFRFPLNIKKLTLSGFHSSIIPKGGELPNLVVLKLIDIYFERNTWDMNEEWEFPKLKLLEMKLLTIDRWTGSDGVDHFPCLEKLVVQACKKLKVVPSCCGTIPTLQMIKVRSCGKIAASLFQKIKEEQNDWGNNIQVLIEKGKDELSEDEGEDELSEDKDDRDEEDELCEDEEEDDL